MLLWKTRPSVCAEQSNLCSPRAPLYGRSPADWTPPTPASLPYALLCGLVRPSRGLWGREPARLVGRKGQAGSFPWKRGVLLQVAAVDFSGQFSSAGSQLLP